MSLFKEISDDAQLHAKIESIELLPSGKGRFEITVNDEILFSKASLGRHAEPGEVYNLIKEKANSNGN